MNGIDIQVRQITLIDDSTAAVSGVDPTNPTFAFAIPVPVSRLEELKVQVSHHIYVTIDTDESRLANMPAGPSGALRNAT